MGTALFSISKYGDKSKNLKGRFVASGAHTTSTTGSNLTDGIAGAGSAVVGNAGDVLTIQMDENARLMFGGEVATQTVGHLVLASQILEYEISGSGNISVCDVA